MQKLKILAIVLTVFQTFAGCNEPKDLVPEDKNDAVIRFSLGGLLDLNLEKNSSLSSIDGLKIEREFEIHEGFETLSSFAKISTAERTIKKYADLPQGTSKLDEGVKYRLIMYRLNEENEEEYYAQLDMESKDNEYDGAPVEVSIGDTYRWYGYSYNNTETMSPITNLAQPIIPMGENADFIYAHGEIIMTEDFESEIIVFERKTAQINLEIDARGLFTDEIRDLVLKLPSNMLKTADFDLMNDQPTAITELPEQTIPLSNFVNVDLGFNDRKQTSFYTAVSENWPNLSFSLNKLDILLDDNVSIGSYPVTNLSIAKQFNIEAGKRYKGKIDFIESALTFGGVSWARENLYRTTGARNPYRFYHENKQTNDFRSYFSFKGHMPGKWGSTIIQDQRDPCALVHPANRWMTPSKIVIQ